jgi:hypothetical protein
VFGVVNPTFHDLPAKLLRQFYALSDPSGVLAKTEPWRNRGPYSSKAPSRDGNDPVL